MTIQNKMYEVDIFKVFEFTRINLVEPKYYDPDNHHDIDLYTLKLRDPKLHIKKSTEYLVGNTSPYTGPATTPYYHQYRETFRRAGSRTIVLHHNQLHYAFPVASAVAFTTNGTPVSLFGIPIRVNRHPGQMDVLRITRHHTTQTPHAARDTYWKLLDQNGVEYHLQFTAEDNGNMIGIKHYFP